MRSRARVARMANSGRAASCWPLLSSVGVMNLTRRWEIVSRVGVRSRVSGGRPV